MAIARAILKNAPIVILDRQLPSLTRRMKIKSRNPSWPFPKERPCW
ncbi:MAG: hypothetical protein ACLTC0_14890 [Eisenbergiella massiliensis]